MADKIISIERYMSSPDIALSDARKYGRVVVTNGKGEQVFLIDCRSPIIEDDDDEIIEHPSVISPMPKSQAENLQIIADLRKEIKHLERDLAHQEDVMSRMEDDIHALHEEIKALSGNSYRDYDVYETD